MEYWEWIYECCPKTGFLIKSVGLRLRIVVLLQASKPGYRGGLGTKLLSCLQRSPASHCRALQAMTDHKGASRAGSLDPWLMDSIFIKLMPCDTLQLSP